MKKTLYAEPVMEVIDIDANIICTSGVTSCSGDNMLPEMDDNG